MARRSNLIVFLGLAVFVVGALATYLLVRDNDEGPTTSGPRATVLYAAKDIPAGTTGSSAVSQGMVRSKAIDVAARPENALTDTSQLAGRTAILGVTEGQVLTADQFRDAQTRIGTLRIPEGKTALALQLNNIAGVAGFAGAGDHINIYGLLKPDTDHPGGAAKLIMQNVEVLNVNGTTLVANQGQPGGAGLVYLLAVNPIEAEQLVYLTSFQQLYFALVAQDQQPVGPTPGVSVREALRQL
jgi:Flp pilus assembly protein CpaB